MRKHCRRQVRQIMQNPVAWVLKGLEPLASIDGELTRTKLKNHAALDALRLGEGTRGHVDILVGSANMANALLQLYKRGAGYEKEIVGFQDAVLAMARRGAPTNKFLFTGPELTAINLAMEIHDAQLDITTVGEIEAAIHHIRKLQRSGNARRITVKEAA